jgi:murein DD-endopeptidase MepM/ murein hydrolase activator NlpD
MHDMHVEEGQTLQPNQQIGTLGNSGNSTGAHLHLEVRGGTNPNAQFYELQANLMTPGVLFLR